MKGVVLIFAFALVAVILAAPASAREGIGISPGCYDTDSQGKCVPVMVNRSSETTRQFEFRVYNFDNDTKDFTVTLAGAPNGTTLGPDAFTLSQHDGPDCPSSNGCQPIVVEIDVMELELGNHIFTVSASNQASGGMLVINQIVQGRVQLRVVADQQEDSSGIILAGVGLIVLLLIAVLIGKHKNGPAKQHKKGGKHDIWK